MVNPDFSQSDDSQGELTGFSWCTLMARTKYHIRIQSELGRSKGTGQCSQEEASTGLQEWPPQLPQRGSDRAQEMLPTMETHRELRPQCMFMAT